MDPMTVIVIGNAIAGFASGLTEQTFSAAGGLIEKIHNRHQPTAAAQMTANITAFGNELNAKIERLSESIDVIASRAEQPAFVVQLQSALLSASQTDSQDVHVLLAGLVSQRLRIETDTTAARACHRACQVIADLTSAQLKILGFLYTVHHMGFRAIPYDIPPDVAALPQSDPRRQAYALEWVQRSLNPYADLTYTFVDEMNLSAVGCGQTAARWGSPTESPLENILDRATGHDLHYQYFKSTELGARLEDAYGRGGMTLTSVGSVLGMFVADQLANRPTDLTDWDG